MMMPHRDGISGTSLLNFEAWRALLRTICGRYNPEGIEPNAFLGWAPPGALVLSKVRRRLTTFNLRRPRFDLRDGNPVGIAAGGWQGIYRLKFKLRRHSL